VGLLSFGIWLMLVGEPSVFISGSQGRWYGLVGGFVEITLQMLGFVVGLGFT
jgi:hypothetical protein